MNSSINDTWNELRFLPPKKTYWSFIVESAVPQNELSPLSLPIIEEESLLKV